MCSVLAHRLNAWVYMFPYELAPSGIAASTLLKLTDFYLKVATSARRQGHEVIVAGDSAGGSISSCLALSIRNFAPLLMNQDLTDRDIEKLQPDQLILISGLLSCNITQEFKELAGQIQPKDWWLNTAVTVEMCERWIGTPALQEAAIRHLVSKSPTPKIADRWRKALPLRTDHPIVDAIGAADSFKMLQKAGVHVTLLCGSHDIFFAYALLFAEQCEKYAVRTTFIEGMDGIHVYPLFGFLVGNPGSSEANDLITSSVLRASKIQ